MAAAANEGSPSLTETSLDEGAVIGFKNVQAGVDKLAFGDDNDVKSTRDLVSTEDLSNQSFSFVSLDRSTQLLRRGDTQPTRLEAVLEQKNRAVPAPDLRTAIVNLTKISASADSLAWAKIGHSASLKLLLFARNGQLLAALCAAPLQHQAAVLRAHSDEKTVRAGSTTGIGLKRALSLHA
jgi:hypothetical protein